MRGGIVSKLAVVAVIGIVGITTSRSCFRPSLRIGTFNIEHFGKQSKDMNRLQAVIEEANSDVLAVQEMRDPDSVRDLAKRLSHDGRRFQYFLTKCPGTSDMHVGFLYDEARVALTRTREYPELDPKGGERCGKERSALAARFDPVNGRPFQLLVVHFIAGGENEQQEKRRKQWRAAHEIAAELAKETPVAIIGDVNSTGFLDDKFKERTFILDEAKRAHFDVVTEDLKCTEYFQPGKQLIPSVLDHVVASPDFSPRRPEVHGYCKRLACKTLDTEPEDFKTVSDHCPVTIDFK